MIHPIEPFSLFTDFDIHLFREGKHFKLYDKMGSHKVEKDGIVQLKAELKKITDEEEKILKAAGKCEKCGKPFKINRGRWGKFLACTGYPECKNIKKIENKK